MIRLGIAIIPVSYTHLDVYKRQASEVPKGEKVVNWAESTWKRKEFRLETLPEKWDIFCRKARENGEQYAGFFQTVHRVKAVSYTHLDVYKRQDI